MADLATLLSDSRETESRAQLILVSAFALAAILLALAVLVNSAIYTENLATRSENVESTQALEYRHGVTQYMSDVIAFANENNNTEDYEAIKENVSDGIADAGVYSALQQAQRGKALSVNVTSNWDEEGSRIFQTDGGSFTSNETEEDWTLVSDVDNTRAFSLELTKIPTDSFSIVVNNTADPNEEWRLNITDDGASDKNVTVITPDSTTRRCSYTSIESVDVTGATVNGEPCPAMLDTEDGKPMGFGINVSDGYAIEFEEADDIEGNYSLVVDNDTLDANTNDNYSELDEPGGPSVTPAVYSATVKLDYETARMEYETEIRIAPGEPR
jgi:hypothetical protein